MPELSPEDRRARARQQTDRPAQCFAQHDGQALTGRVTNVSAGGLQVQLSRALEPGENWEVEVAPKAGRHGESTILVRAEVLWHRKNEDDTHSHGMRLHMPLDRVGVGAPLEAFDVALRVAVFQDALATMTQPGDLMPFTRLLDATTSSEDGDKSSDWRRHAIVFLLLILFLGSLATCLDDSERDSADRRETYQPERSESETVPGFEVEQRVSHTDLESAGGRLLSLDQAYHAFLHGERDDSKALLNALDAVQDLGAVERFMVRAAKAQMTYAGGKTSDGIAAMHQALNEAPAELPDAWRAAGEEMLGEFPQTLAGTVPLWGLYRSALINEADLRVPDSTPGAVHVEIDLSDYLLRIYEGDQLAAVLPVGIGETDGTPMGSFRIANKLKNPVWYNRGKPVPPGDPENPLGDLWLGLGQGGRALPIGLHPTNEPDSIGAARSAGCIRLRPADAATLDERCAVGTPVRIVP